MSKQEDFSQISLAADSGAVIISPNSYEVLMHTQSPTEDISSVNMDVVRCAVLLRSEALKAVVDQEILRLTQETGNPLPNAVPPRSELN